MAECLPEFTNAELPFSGTEVLDAGKKIANAASQTTAGTIQTGKMMKYTGKAGLEPEGKEGITKYENKNGYHNNPTLYHRFHRYSFYFVLPCFLYRQERGKMIL